MERLLQDINAVVGVTGSFVCDKDGTLVARALPSVFDETMLLPAARTILQTVAGLETTRRRKVNELDLVYAEGRIVVKNLRVGLVYIICVHNVNVPLLNLTANVAARKLSQMLKEREAGKELSESMAKKIDRLGQIAKDFLDDDSVGVVATLLSASESPEDLMKACDEVERVTRLFLDGKGSREMAQKMRAAIQE